MPFHVSADPFWSQTCRPQLDELPIGGKEWTVVVRHIVANTGENAWLVQVVQSLSVDAIYLLGCYPYNSLQKK